MTSRVKPRILVLAGPGGVGKNTVQAALVQKFPNQLVSITKWTTRPRRIGEHEGAEFHFVTTKAFQEGLRDNKLLEHTFFNGNFYGVPRQPVDDTLRNQRSPVLVIEKNGAAAIQRHYPGQSLAIFLTAPLAELRQRYIERGQTSVEADARMNIAKEELAQHSWSDLVVENRTGQLDQTVEAIAKAITSK